MSLKFSQIKVQRANRRLEISQHPSYIPIPKAAGEQVPSPHEVHIQLRPDMPHNMQPAPVTVRNGSIYMKSRNVPGRNIYPGMVLLLDLARAAAVLADDSYEIASEEDIRVELERQAVYKADMADRDRQLRMQASGVENNITVQQAPQPPINVSIAMPDWMEALMKKGAGQSAEPESRRGRRAAVHAPTDDSTSESPASEE